MQVRILLFLALLLLAGAGQEPDSATREKVIKNLKTIAGALEKHHLARHFALLPWDQMQPINGPEDRVHGLASLVECNFTYAGFPRVADLKACEALGLKAIVYPDASLGLTERVKQLTDSQIENSVQRLVEQTRD